MKILQLIDTLNPGGAERMCVNIANSLFQNGIEIIVCTTRSEGDLRAEILPGIAFYCLNKKRRIGIKAFRYFLKILKSEKPDLIHAHSTSVFWAVAAKVGNRKIKIIWHDHLGNRENHLKINIAYKTISHYIDAVIATNRELKDWSYQNMRVAKDKIVFLNNFPALKEIEKHTDPDFFTIVCVANILPVKNHELLIKAISLLRTEEFIIPLKVKLAGYYLENDYFKYLNDLVSLNKLDYTIIFLGKEENVSKLLSESDCGVLCSSSEGLPVSLLEYGLASLPVIVTDVGQCSEVVENGKYGKLVKAGDTKAFAEELLWIMRNKDAAQKMGEDFKEHVNKNYGAANFLKGYNKLLGKVLKND